MVKFFCVLDVLCNIESHAIEKKEHQIPLAMHQLVTSILVLCRSYSPLNHYQLCVCVCVCMHVISHNLLQSDSLMNNPSCTYTVLSLKTRTREVLERALQLDRCFKQTH